MGKEDREEGQVEEGRSQKEEQDMRLLVLELLPDLQKELCKKSQGHFNYCHNLLEIVAYALDTTNIATNITWCHFCIEGFAYAPDTNLLNKINKGCARDSVATNSERQKSRRYTLLSECCFVYFFASPPRVILILLTRNKNPRRYLDLRILAILYFCKIPNLQVMDRWIKIHS